MAIWVKTFREGNPHSPLNSPTDLPPIGGTRRFLEPLSTNADGSPKLTRHGERMGKPSYEIGDLIASYWNGSYEIATVWEVIGEPEESSLADWSWEADVRLVKIGPRVGITDLGIRPQTLGRRVRLRLRADQETLFRDAFDV